MTDIYTSHGITKKSAFLIGRTDLILADDFNPAIAVDLRRNDSATVRGQVIGAGNEPAELILER